MHRQGTFISLADEDFSPPWLSRQHLMLRLAEYTNVLHVTPPVQSDQVVPLLRSRGLRSVLPKSTVIAPSLVHIDPGGCFPRFFETRHRLNSISLAGRIKLLQMHLRRRGWKGRQALFVWNPDFHDYFGRFGEAISFFHCVDYFPNYWPASSRRHAQSLRDLESCLRKADVVFSVSAAIDRCLRELVDRPIVRLAHGVEFPRFVDSSGGPVPRELASTPTPRIGYIGRINGKVDTNLLADIAAARPAWTIVLLGPIVSDLDDVTRTGLARLEALPNAVLLGSRHPSELPPYFHCLDAGLLTYHLDRWIPYSSPLKYLEFLAAGKPVVSVDIESLRDQDRQFVRCASTLPGWLEAIEAMLEEDSPDASRSRQVFASANTWDDRARQVLSHIPE